MSLARKHSREPFPPELFHRRKNTRLVVDHDVMARRVVPLNVGQHLLLVDVDENPAFDRIPQARSFHFARLEDHVSIGQDGRFPKGAGVFEGVERTRVQPVGKRIVHKK